MHLVIIGGTSAEKIKGLIQTNFDYLEVSIYQNIPDFYSTANVRSMQIDRIFIMQDGLTKETTEDMLGAFNDYLGKYYPSIRLVSLLNDEATIELISNVFISPFMVHVMANKMKPRMLNELVEGRPEALRKKYNYISKNKDSAGVIGEIVDELEDEDLIEDSTLPNPDSAGVTTVPQKNGFFGLFKGKSKTPKPSKVKAPKSRGKKKNQKGQERTYQPLDIEDPIEQPQQEQDVDSTNLEETNTEDQGIQTTFEGTPELETDIDFSMFDEDSNVGVGVEIPNSESVQDEPEEDPDLDFNAFEEDYIEPQEEDYVKPQEEKGEEENDPSLEELAISGLDFQLFGESEEGKEGNNLEQEDDDSEEQNQERLQKLNQIKDSIFEKGIISNTEDLKTPVIDKPSINVTQVEDEIPLFDDIDDISEQYEKENIKVVETVIEKVIQVGGKDKTYKNGIRVLIFTGDRKTGVTRTALNASAHFAKQTKTLYVDFDIERKGSLLYLGLENVAEHEEHIQNGVNYLKNINILPNVTHTFLKGGFDCLTSMHGMDVTEDHLKKVQRILATQRDYKTIVIDCPLENLHYLEDIILHSEILVCVESDLPSTLNTILGLSSVTENEQLLTFLYNNSQFLLSKDNKEVEFRKNMSYIADMFSLDEAPINWGSLPIIGSVVDFRAVLKKI